MPALPHHGDKLALRRLAIRINGASMLQRGALSQLHGQWTITSDQFSPFHRNGQYFLSVTRRSHQTNDGSIFARNESAGNEQIHCMRIGHLLKQLHGSAARGNNPPLHLGEAQFGVAISDSYVSSQRQFQTARYTVTIDCRNEWLAEITCL